MTIHTPSAKALAAAQRHAEADFAARKYADAALLCQRLLALALSDEQRVAALYVRAMSLLELKRTTEAASALEHAAELAPRRADIRAQHARMLVVQRKMPAALVAAELALAHLPQHPQGDAITLAVLGGVFSRANAHARALVAYQRAIAMDPHNAAHQLALANTLKFLGHFEAAHAAYEECIRLQPGQWSAYFSRAQLKTATPDSNPIEALTALLPKVADNPAAQLRLHMTLAKTYEDLGEPAAMFEHLQRGKSARRAELKYEFAADAAIFKAVKDMPLQTGGGAASAEPIFVLGMARSGTTLVERILSSHNEVYSAGELFNFGIELAKATGVQASTMLDPAVITASRMLDWRALGEAYLASTRPQTAHKPRFVDKLPLNYFYLQAIHQALPNAKIICLRRHPLETVLGNYKQIFSLNTPYYRYSYDLLDTARYVAEFTRLMQHWQRQLPGVVLEIRYETLVSEQEGETRRLLAHCDLPWDATCLQFEKNPQPVATASAVQVRAPINKLALGRWRRYEAELAPARALLEQQGICCD